MKAKSISQALCAALVVCLASCGGQEKLSRAVDDLNRQCPVTLELTGELITGAAVERGNLVLYYDVDEDEYNLVDDIIRDYPELLQQNTILVLQNAEELRDVYAAAIDEAAGLEIHYTSSESGHTAILTMTADDLAAWSPFGDDDPLEVLKREIEQTNASLPIQIEEGLRLDSLEMQGDMVIHSVNVNESIISMSELMELADELKATLVESLTDPDLETVAYVNLYRNAHKGIAYRYTGNSTGLTFMVTVPPDDI